MTSSTVDSKATGKKYTVATMEQKQEKEKIVRTDRWDTDLSAEAVETVNGAVLSIKSSFIRAVRETSDAFTEIKDALPRGNWMTFCDDSELGLGFGSRTIRDYVAINSWLKETTAADATLAAHSIRTLAIICGLNDTNRQALQRRIESGTRVTQAEAVKAAQSEKPAKDRSGLKTLKDYKAIVEVLEAQKEAIDAQRKSILKDADALGDENRELKEKVRELQRDLAAFHKMGEEAMKAAAK